MLYLLSFYLPRFLNHSFEEKLTTVIHELWHISPSFNGDLRRLPGRCYAHGSSEREYHKQMEALAAKWLSLDPPADVHRFLRQLQATASLARRRIRRGSHFDAAADSGRPSRGVSGKSVGRAAPDLAEVCTVYDASRVRSSTQASIQAA